MIEAMKLENQLVLVRTFLTIHVYSIKCLFRKCILRKNSHFNQQTHRGELPIRVLQYNILEFLEKVSPDYFQLIKDEIQSKGLSPGIKYNIDKQEIIHAATVNAANINSKRVINIYETFNAYLWCVSYSLIVAFDETIQKPHLKGTYNGRIDQDNELIRSAINVFDYGMSLRTNYSAWNYSMPNPESHNCKYSFYVEKANLVFTSAMFFVLSHEIGHSYYDHVTYIPPTAEQSIEEELAADNFALTQVLSCRDETIKPSLQYGAVVGMCALLFLSPKLYSKEYPDADDRIRNIMEQLPIKDLDLHWGVASLAFKLWGDFYGINFSLPTEADNYKEIFYEVLFELNSIKKNERTR